MPKEVTVKQVKQVIRRPFIWPGGYETVLVLSDGAILCWKCARDNFREITESMTRYDYGWRVIGFIYEAVSAECVREVDSDLVSECSHCYREFGEFDTLHLS